jgi:predicted nucleic acid-binding protein
MAFKVFLDANILLDFLLKRSGYESSKDMIRLVIDKKIQAFITPAIVHIVGYWLTKSYGKAKAKELLLLLLADVHVIDANHQTTILALHSQIEDIEDALQYYTAIHHKLDFFITRDKNFQKVGLPSLPVCSIEDFLKFTA